MIRILPRFSDFILYSVVTFLLMAALSWRQIYAKLAGGNEEVQKWTELYLDDGIEVIEALPAVPTAVTVIFWMIVGLMIFGIISAILSFIHDIKQTKDDVTDFVHPKGYSKGQQWMTVFFKETVAITRLILIAGLGIGAFFYLLPATIERFGRLVISPNTEIAGQWGIYFALTVLALISMRTVLRIHTH